MLAFGERLEIFAREDCGSRAGTVPHHVVNGLLIVVDDVAQQCVGLGGNYAPMVLSA